MGNTDKPDVQGEGDYEASRRYRKEVQDYMEKADVDKAAHAAAPQSPDERREMDEAERAGRSHSKASEEREMNLKSESKKTQQ